MSIFGKFLVFLLMKNLNCDGYFKRFCRRTTGRMKILRPSGERLGSGDTPKFSPSMRCTMALVDSAARSTCFVFGRPLPVEVILALDNARRRNILPGFRAFQKASPEPSFDVSVVLIAGVLRSEVFVEGQNSKYSRKRKISIFGRFLVILLM